MKYTKKELINFLQEKINENEVLPHVQQCFTITCYSAATKTAEKTNSKQRRQKPQTSQQ